MKKPGISRIAALIMGLALAIPTGAAAEGWTKAQEKLGLGTSMIKNPTAPTNDNDPWKGSYVYYGQYQIEDKQKGEYIPVKYRVLNKRETKFTDGTTGERTPTLFLDCDNMLYTSPFDRWDNLKDYQEKRTQRRDYFINKGIPVSDDESVWATWNQKTQWDPWVTNDWEECTTRDYLNGYNLTWNITKVNTNSVFYKRDGVFSSAERAAIIISQMAQPSGQPSNETMVPTGLAKGDHIFLLDITDVESKDYGYGSNGARKKVFSPFVSDKNFQPQWWLRTPNPNNEKKQAVLVNNEGKCVFENIPNAQIGASPAFNVKLSSIVFTSLVSGDAGKDGAEYKLTLLDASMDITPNTVTPNGNTVTVSYDVTGDHAGQATHVSVLVTDGEWTENGWNGGEVKYYEQFAITNDKTVSFDLPGDYDVSSWKTYILAENVASGEYAANTTDYASAPKQLTLKFITATATGYTGTYDGKAHGINVTVTSPDSGFTVNYGTTAGNYAQTSSPTITHVANSPLTVYYQITANGYITKTGSADVTISKADPIITTAPKANDRTYNGTEKPLVTAGTPKGGTMVYSLEKDKGYSAEIPMGTDADTYTVYYMVSGDANYNDVTSDDYKLTVSIARKPVTVKAADKSKTSGEGDPALTAIVKGLVDLEDHKLIKYTLTRAAGEAVGTYAITPTGEKLQGNYAVTFENGTLTIEQKSSDSKSGGNESSNGGTSGGGSQGTNGGTSSGGSQGTSGGTSSGGSQGTSGGTSDSGSQGSDNGTAGNGSQGTNGGTSLDGTAIGYEKADKELAEMVEKKLTELLPGLPDDVKFFSDTDNMEFKGVNGLTSYIEKIIDELKGTVRELTAVMSPVSVKTAGVYFVKVNVTEEQSKELIGTRNLAYHIELYLENKEEAQVRIADAGEGESDVPTGKFVDENGDVVSGAYGGGDIYLLVYVPKADTTYVQYMTAEADQKPLEETTGNSSSPTSDSTSPSGYSGPTSNKGPGGCDAGFGGLAGLMILPLLARRRKK